VPPSPSSDESNSPVAQGLVLATRDKKEKPKKEKKKVSKASSKEENEEVGVLLKKFLHDFKKEGYRIPKDKYKTIFKKAQGKVLEEWRTKEAKKASDGKVAPLKKFLKKRRQKIRELVRKYVAKFAQH